MFVEKTTAEGIQFVDTFGSSLFLSFNECNENWLAYRKRTEFLNDEQVNNLRGKDRTIGQRNADTTKNFIEFFTRPFIRFEFDNPEQVDAYRNLRDTIQTYGWTTHDLS